MARESPTIWQCGHNYPIEVAILGSAWGCVLEDVAPSVLEDVEPRDGLVGGCLP